MIEINEQKIIDEESMSMEDWIVDVPTTQKELNDRFNLKNDEISIDRINFSNIYIKECDLYRVDIPTSQDDLKRFLYET